MARLMRIAILVASILFVGRAYAAGGTCPSGANYTNPADPNGPLVTLASMGIKNCFYIAANGADSNSGTSESSPCLHAPKMPNCSANCASVQNQNGGIPRGTGLILRGGDTWHFGNSGASPYTGGTWNFNTSPTGDGTSSAWIYVGVDPSWFSGSSWARPVMNADNPLCNASLVNGTTCSSSGITGLSGATQYYVSSCAYTIAGGSNNFIEAGARFYYYFDNFEYTGLCQSGNGQPSHSNRVFSYGALGTANEVNTFANNYFHGWTHLRYAGFNGGPNCTSSVPCLDISMFEGGTASGEGANYIFNVMDGSDSDPEAGEWATSGTDQYNVAYNIIRYTSQGLANSMHAWHDNLVEYFFENGHSNVLESKDACPISAVYNNVFRHMETVGAVGGVLLWLGPQSGCTTYAFNNLAYDVGGMEYLNVGGTAITVVGGNYVWFNNTFQSNVNQPILRCAGYSNGTVVDANNHYVDDGSYLLGTCSTLKSLTSLQHTNSQATSAGYTSSEIFAYSPNGSNSPTVGVGTNEGTLNGAFCSVLSTAAATDPTLSDAASACTNDTHYACAYNISNNSVSCPARTVVARPAHTAWNVGAYQSGTSQGNAPNPPSNLTAAVE